MRYRRTVSEFVVVAIGLCVAIGGTSSRRAMGIELPPMGINAMGYAYWGTALPFVDVAHMANQWITQQPTQLTSTGYPAALAPGDMAQGLVFTNNGAFYPTGQYTLQWQGSGDVNLAGPNVSVVSSQPQKIVYNVTSADPRGVVVQITRTDPTNPVKSISLRAPFPNAGTGAINSAYEKDLANYGVIRNMGFNATNNSTQTNWTDRATPASAFWGGNLGVPYEYQIQLSNELKEDLWINVPHLATDDYVRSLAQLVKQTLAPGLRVWVEYSNEVWNTGFQQTQYAENVLKPQYGVANAAQAYGRRSAEVFDAFTSQFTDQNRVVRVIAGQAANPGVLSESLKGATVNGTLKADVAAIAPYFTLDIDKFYAAHLAGTANLDSAFAELHTSIDTLMVPVAQNEQIAAAHNLPLVGYEGGQHLLARPGEQHNDQAFVDLLTQMNRDDRMGQLYTYLLDQWYSKGGKTFTFAGDVASPSKWGDWGLQETYLDTNAVKYKAVQQYLQRMKSSAADLNKDGVIDQRDYDLWRSTEGATQSLYADANGDGVVDGADYVVWRKGLSASAAAISAHYSDFNGDGVTDARDYVLWRKGLSANGLASGLAIVPEPSSVALAFGAIYISLVDVRWLLPRH
jgi:hypothetical protein